MLQQIKQTAVVNGQGKIEIYSPQLPIGATVEVTIRLVPMDTTDYLLSTEANKQHLLQAIEELKDSSHYVYLDNNAL